MSDAFGFNKEAQEKAKGYLHSGLQVSMCKGLVLLVLGLMVLGLRLPNMLEDSIKTYAAQPWLVVAIFALVGYVVFWLVSLPFEYYSGHVLERRFGLSDESPAKWFVEHLKISILIILVVFSIAEGVYNFMWLDQTYWWFYFWFVSALVIVLFMYVFPVLIMPLFYKLPRLKDEELLNTLTKLADKAGIKVIGVFEMKVGAKTKKASAALTGIGRTRRILLSDTFLSSFTKDETESVMGHEIGHYVYGHIWKLAALFTLGFLLMLLVTDQVLRVSSGYFGIPNIGSAASFPLLALTLGLLYAALAPLVNTLSRHAEGRCDQYGLDLAGRPDAHISAMTKLCDQNLRYAYPSPIVEFCFYDHPSGKKRVERALRYQEAQTSK